MAVKDPSENAHWPAYFYPPETNPEAPEESGKLYHKPEDVPEGWAHHWSEHGSNLDKAPPQAAQVERTRQELKDELTKRDIPFSPTAAKAELQKLLDEADAADALDAQV